MRVISGNALVDVDYHQFYLDAGGEVSWTGETSTGLIEPLGKGAVVVTGVAAGGVRCAYKAYSSGPPPAAEVDDWDDVVEVAVQVGEEGLHIAGWGGMSFEDTDLAIDGPGTYVVRCSARNREAELDEAVDVAQEEYLIETWSPLPGAAREARILRQLRQTDSVR